MKFTLCDGENIRVDWGGRSKLVNNLRALRSLLAVYEEFEVEDVVRLGLLAALLAARGLERAGTQPSRSNIMRILDEYDFIVDDELYYHAFQRGLEEGIDLVRSNPENFEVEIWRILS